MPSMSEKIEKKMEKNGEDMKKNYPQPLRIARVIYGTKELTECMESVIKIHNGI